MNYTEKYHLPQWIESDRIMMDDFNQMCADIEAGLSQAAQTADALTQANDTRDKRLNRQLLRLAYNHYLATQTINPFPKQMGMFYQQAVRDLPSLVGEVWDGARFLGTGTGDFTTETFFQKCGKVISNLVMDKYNPANSKPLEVEICAPVTTKVTNFNLYGNIADNVPTTYAPFQLTLKNLDTGEMEQSTKLDLRCNIEAGILVNNPQPTSLYFLSGCHYLLKIEPIGNPVFSSDLMLRHGDAMTIKTSGGTGKKLDFSRTMKEETSSSLGVLTLKCKAGGATGQLTVKWDGKIMEPIAVQPCQNEQGLSLKEFIYFRQETIPAASTISVTFDCGANGGIWLQDWGAFLL